MALKFCAVKKYKDGGEQVHEYFSTQDEALQWIAKQPKPKDDTWRWCVGEWG